MKMKKVLLLLTLLSSLLTFGQQRLDYQLTIIDSTTSTVVPNQQVWMSVYSSGTFYSSYYYLSNGAGQSSIMVYKTSNMQLNVGIPDCQGNVSLETYTISPSDTLLVDTIYIGCAGYPVFDCYSDYHIKQQAGLQIQFADTSAGRPLPIQGTVVDHYWSFGDGSGLVSYKDTITHTYSQAGTFQATIFRSIRDTVRKFVYCQDTIYKTVVVTASSGTFCKAEFTLDTLASTNGIMKIYNTSTPVFNNSNYNTSYLWDFGDGATSNQPFPSHVYQQFGVYNICLTVTSIDQNQNTCFDTFCDTLGMDSTGTLKYKNSGFKVVISNPASMDISETSLDSKVAIYPNPATHQVNIKTKLGKLVDWQISDINGAILLSGVQDFSKNHQIDISSLSRGIYIISISDGDFYSNSKLMVK